jgi:diguanylate cyclase (GGDEF)-like protein
MLQPDPREVLESPPMRPIRPRSISEPPNLPSPVPPPAPIATPLVLLRELAEQDTEANLGHNQLERLAQVAEVRVFAPGEVLFYEGDPSDAVYLIVSGDVDIAQRGMENRQMMARGYSEFVGEMGVIEARPRSATARARGEVQTLRFTKDAFLELINTAPFLVWKLMRNISARLRQREQEHTAWLQLRNKELAEAAARLQNMNNVLEQLVAERTRELAVANERLKALAVTDEVTGLYNRRFLQQILERKAEAIARTPHPFSVIMVDIDHFKHYNDRNGHLAGDGVLRTVCDLMRAVIRGGDILARYGGEEFCIILESATKVDALHVADKLRRAVMGHTFPEGEFQPLGTITISLGVASYPEDAESVMSVLDKADHALYQAKRDGRNRIATLQPAARSEDAPFD